MFLELPSSPKRQRSVRIAKIGMIGALLAGFVAILPTAANAYNLYPDFGTWSIGGPAAPVMEGNSGTTAAGFTLTTSTALKYPCGIAINAVNGTATAGADYDLALPPTGATLAAFGTSGDATKVTYYASSSTGYWLRFPAGTPAGYTFTIPANVKGDTTVEADETFSANIASYALADGLGTLGCSYDTAGIFTASATITNDDLATPDSSGVWTIAGPGAKPEGNSGATPSNFTLTTSAALTKPCGVAVNVINGTAAAGVDYDLMTPPTGATTATIGTAGDPTKVTYFASSATGYWLRFPAGTPAGYDFSIPVSLKGDTIVESDETFSATITSYALADSLGTTGCGFDLADSAKWTAAATITNDDLATTDSLGIWTIGAPAAKAEGNTGNTPVGFSLTTSTALTKPCGIAINVINGTATAGVDYDLMTPPTGATTATIGTAGDPAEVTHYASSSTGYWLRFPAGTPAGYTFTIPVDVKGDTTVEADETFSATITSYALADSLGTTGCGYEAADSGRWTAAATITNDDPAAPEITTTTLATTTTTTTVATTDATSTTVAATSETTTTTAAATATSSGGNSGSNSGSNSADASASATSSTTTLPSVGSSSTQSSTTSNGVAGATTTVGSDNSAKGRANEAAAAGASPTAVTKKNTNVAGDGFNNNGSEPAVQALAFTGSSIATILIAAMVFIAAGLSLFARLKFNRLRTHQ